MKFIFGGYTCCGGMSMKKRIYAAALAGILVLAQAVTAFAGRPIHVTLDGFLLDMGQGAVVVDGQVKIEARVAAEIFGDDVLRLTPVEIDGREMLPALSIAGQFMLRANWDEDMGILRLSSEHPDYSLLARVPDAAATVEMSFTDAMERINSRDARLLAMEENRIFIEREEREINEYLRDNNIRGLGNRRTYTMIEVQMLRAREAVRNQQQTLEINEGLIRAGNEMQLRAALADVARARLDITLMEHQLALEERNIVLVELLHSLGMESAAGARDAQNSLARTRTNLENLRILLDNSHLTLNRLLGLPAYEIVKIYDISREFGEEPTLQNHLDNMLANAPNLALLRLDLSFAQFVYHSYDVLLLRDYLADDYRYRGRRQYASIVIEMRNDINAATRALNNARDNLENRIRGLHNDIEALREQQGIAQRDLANAIEDYQDVMLRYITGMATWLEMERAKLVILNHEIALARHEVNLGMLMLLYQRPYLN